MCFCAVGHNHALHLDSLSLLLALGANPTQRVTASDELILGQEYTSDNYESELLQPAMQGGRSQRAYSPMGSASSSLAQALASQAADLRQQQSAAGRSASRLRNTSSRFPDRSARSSKAA